MMTYTICHFTDLVAAMIQYLSYDHGWCLIVRKPWKNITALIDEIVGFGDERTGTCAFADCLIVNGDREAIEALEMKLLAKMESPILIFIEGKFVPPDERPA